MFFAVVDEPAGQRASLGMMMLDRRFHERHWGELALEIKRMVPLHDAPAVVVAFFDEERLLPQVLAVLADPEVARLFIDAHAPRSTQAERPDFRACAFHGDERIVFRDRITPGAYATRLAFFW